MGARPWTCPHGVPLGQYCRDCAAGRGRAATLLRAHFAAVLAAIEDGGWWR